MAVALNITCAQEAYLKRLLDLAFSRRVEHGLRLERNRLGTLSAAEASASISTLKRALEAPKEGGF